MYLIFFTGTAQVAHQNVHKLEMTRMQIWKETFVDECDKKQVDLKD